MDVQSIIGFTLLAAPAISVLCVTNVLKRIYSFKAKFDNDNYESSSRVQSRSFTPFILTFCFLSFLQALTIREPQGERNLILVSDPDIEFKHEQYAFLLA